MVNLLDIKPGEFCSVTPNSIIYKKQVCEFLSSLVPGEKVSLGVINRCYAALQFSDEGGKRPILLCQVQKIYLLLILKQLYKRISYADLAVSNRLIEDNQHCLDQVWLYPKNHGGISKEHFNKLMMEFYIKWQGFSLDALSN